MKLITFRHNGTVKAGVLTNNDRIIVKDDGPDAAYAVRRLIEGETGVGGWQGGEASLDLSDVELLAPIPDPRRNIFCVGKNYYAHAKEFNDSGFDSSTKEEVPSVPVIFTKATTSVIGPNASILSAMDPTDSVDYECELCFVISKKAHKVTKADCFDYIFGYTILNDVTARYLQQRHNQWFLGKSLDSFAPMGPSIVTIDEIGDITTSTISTTVNGELRQQAKIADLIFDIPTLMETLTATMTLLPGDIIATGTPVGVGLGFKPPKFLKAGDLVSVAVDSIGTLTNPVQ
ncbi:MAG: fumarylacetoacetate hydrolase family protein [Proteobacteria bacterium]|nr:fumarylacetoacetate hydrolase family protein [Pseudomonadota bacterium]MDA0844735.1 fumarylacetoacetate hydrolase family protein [Pseudomonadota bacterium]